MSANRFKLVRVILQKKRVPNLFEHCIESSCYGMVRAYFDILNRLGVTHECDRQTDRHSHS